MNEVLTSQQWMQHGLPVFVSSALEAMDREDVEEGRGPYFSRHEAETIARPTEELMDVALTWEGIIGYTSYITEAVRKLDQRK